MTDTIAHDMTAEKFLDWLDRAAPGSRLEYYRGHLAYDRESVVELGRNSKINAHVFKEPLYSLSETVRSAADQGKVLLCQKRLGWGEYMYLAIKRSK